jgi:hypothetical protein
MARAWGYFIALVSLYKDSSMNEHPGHTVLLWGLHGSGFSCSRDLFYLISGYLNWRKNGLTI